MVIYNGMLFVLNFTKLWNSGNDNTCLNLGEAYYMCTATWFWKSSVLLNWFKSSTPIILWSNLIFDFLLNGSPDTTAWGIPKLQMLKVGFLICRVAANIPNKQSQQATRDFFIVGLIRTCCKRLIMGGGDNFHGYIWKIIINSPTLLKRNIKFIKKLHKRILSGPIKLVLSYQLHSVLNNFNLQKFFSKL